MSTTIAGRTHAAEWLALAGFVAICFAAAGVGSMLTATSVDSWYQTLLKPAWNPPDWIFGPVWSALYLLMGIAAWLVWLRRKVVDVRPALIWFFVQLALNVLWSGLFFGMRSPGAALVEIVVLWAAICTTLVLFGRIRRAAGALLVPYLAWVTFASALNFQIWRLN